MKHLTLTITPTQLRMLYDSFITCEEDGKWIKPELQIESDVLGEILTNKLEAAGIPIEYGETGLYSEQNFEYH